MTPISAETMLAACAVDTSVAVPFLDAAHSAHTACVAISAPRRPALSGHAAFETFSVLTRMPGPARVLASDALAALRAAFPDPCWLAADEHADLLRRLAATGIAGGAVYDALVGEAARARQRTLLTRDLRATRTYDLLGVPYEIIE